MDLMTRTVTGPGREGVGAPGRRSSSGSGAELRWSPAWVLEPTGEPGTLVLSAGADRRVAIDGVGPGDRAAVERWQAEGRVADRPRPVEQDRLLDRLVELGAVAPALAPLPPAVLCDDPGVAASLRSLLAAGTSGVPGGVTSAADVPGPAGEADVSRDRATEQPLVLAVRTGAGWPVVPAGRLHLGVDLALHHTIVLGPLVAPGVTSCLACMDARTSHRWGVAAVPPAPAARRAIPVVAALVDVQVRLARAGTSPLVNATVAWNLETGTTDRQALYKLPGCPSCAATVPAGRAAGRGRVALPWAASP
jgi:hypothetical protein